MSQGLFRKCPDSEEKCLAPILAVFVIENGIMGNSHIHEQSHVAYLEHTLQTQYIPICFFLKLNPFKLSSRVPTVVVLDDFNVI